MEHDLSPTLASTQTDYLWWSAFYKAEFDITVDFTGVEIPKWREHFDRILLIPQGLTVERVIHRLTKLFKCDIAEEDAADLNEAYSSDLQNVRDTEEKSYAIRVIDEGFRPPREYNGRRLYNTNDDLLDTDYEIYLEDNFSIKGNDSITLLERLILELVYFKETGGHHYSLELYGICRGSRDYMGHFWQAYWWEDEDPEPMFKIETLERDDYLDYTASIWITEVIAR